MMKKLSSVCLLLIMALYAGLYAAFYSIGWVTHSDWACLYLPLSFLALFLLSPALLGIWITSLLLRKNRIWTTGAILIFAMLVVSRNTLPPPAGMLIKGLSAHIAQDCTMDDLRHFARDVQAAIPNGNIQRADFSHLTVEQAVAYKRLKAIYPFLNWSMKSRHGPFVLQSENELQVDWGSGFLGVWGLWIFPNGMKPDISFGTTQTLRLSDDIYCVYRE